MMHWGAIQPGFHLGGGMRLRQLYGDDLDVKFESLAGDPENSWLCLRYSMADYWSGEEFKIDDKVYLAPTRPHFGGLRWWFVAASAAFSFGALTVPRYCPRLRMIDTRQLRSLAAVGFLGETRREDTLTT